MFRCVRPVAACLARCHENVVRFSRCATSFGDFQSVNLARSTHVLWCAADMALALLFTTAFFLNLFFFAMCVSITMSDSDRGE